MYSVFETSAIQVLKLCKKKQYTMRQLLKELRQNHDNSYKIIKELDNVGFIKLESKKNGNGRPIKTASLTQLGSDYLNSHLQNELKCMKITENRIRKAKKLADFTEELKRSGINPYDRFIEMNQIALSIRSTA